MLDKLKLPSTLFLILPHVLVSSKAFVKGIVLNKLSICGYQGLSHPLKLACHKQCMQHIVALCCNNVLHGLLSKFVEETL